MSGTLAGQFCRDFRRNIYMLSHSDIVIILLSLTCIVGFVYHQHRCKRVVTCVHRPCQTRALLQDQRVAALSSANTAFDYTVVCKSRSRVLVT